MFFITAFKESVETYLFVVKILYIKVLFSLMNFTIRRETKISIKCFTKCPINFHRNN